MADYEYPDMVSYRTRLGWSTRPNHSLEQIQEWYRDCRGNHRRCKSATPTSAFLPSRLVEIIPARDGRSDVKIRLRSRTELMESMPEYASLSHRWAANMPFKLTTANLKDCSKDFPHDSISKVFQDAICLALQLNLRYIWIDSLCIIQDSRTDWKLESMEMSRIYNHSLLNIASTGFRDGDKGLYANRDPQAHLSHSCRAEVRSGAALPSSERAAEPADGGARGRLCPL